MKKRLPIGTENFEKLLNTNCYYVDKTEFISDLLNNRGDVNLFTRPRRFGKTLNMDMLKTFFEIGQDGSLFTGLKIADNKEVCDSHMGKYPVISISLKGAVGSTFNEALGMMKIIISKEIRRHEQILDSASINSQEKETINKYLSCDVTISELGDSIKFLSDLLYRHYGKNVIILIDEYDVPLDKAYIYGYYDEMITLIRNLLGQALKTNSSLYFAVLTGCLRISKESIFTGLNNLKVFSIANTQFSEYFGFTNEEVKKMLEYYGHSDRIDETKLWYDGYRFGTTEMYNPWDVLNHCYELNTNPNAQPQAYWINTSGNDIVRKLITRAKATTKSEVEQLIAGESVRKTLNLELTYRELEDSIENIWSVLYTTGYLTHAGQPSEDEFDLVIPNECVRKIFKVQIYDWFKSYVAQDRPMLDDFCLSFRNGDDEKAEQLFTQYLRKVISIRDTNSPIAKKENFYHGILLGLFSHMDDWIVRSNVGSGDGYSDIIIEIPDLELGIIIEVKYGENKDMEQGCRKALKQIDELDYIDALVDDGMETILKFGVACYKKRCRIIKGE